MKKIVSFFLALVMCLGTAVVALEIEKIDFADVKESDWFYNDVYAAVELKLIDGRSPTVFAPNENLTCAEAIKLAACMHQLFTSGVVTITNGTPWYITYVDYCYANGIITKEYTYEDNITREAYAEIFANAIPADKLKIINNVPDDSIPDVPSSSAYAASIYTLYRAGILSGVDEARTYLPSANVKRSEVATVIARITNADVRRTFSLGEDVHITENPQSVELEAGKTATLTVAATAGVAPYTYQWLYQSTNGWYPINTNSAGITGVTTETLSIKNTVPSTISVRCVVTDAIGKKVVSSGATVLFTPVALSDPLTIKTQPVDTSVNIGTDVKLPIEVTGGTAPYTYQWQMNIGPSWVRISDNDAMTGTTTAELGLKSTSTPSWIEVRCVVTDATGKSVTTNGVKVEFN